MPILSLEIVSLINAHIPREQSAHLAYHAVDLWADDMGYVGTQHWARKQALDELDHRDKLQHYLVKLGAKPVVPTGDAPPTAWADLPGMFEYVMGLEKTVTKSINEINAAAIAEGDGLTQERMIFFTHEQRVSLGEIADIQKFFKVYGTQGAALALIDKRIGKL